MLVVYNKDTTDFNNLGIKVLHDAKNVTIEQEINIPPVLTFMMPQKSAKAYIDDDSVIDCEGQRFRYKITHDEDSETDRTTKKTALSLYEADGMDKFIANIPDTMGTTPAAMMATIWAGTSFHIMTDAELSAKGLAWVTTPLDWWSVDKTYPVLATQTLLQNIGRGELYIDNYNIAIVQALGKDNGTLLEPGKNLKTVARTRDATNIITRLWAFGRDDLPLPAPGYVDSPLIEQLGVKERHLDYPDVTDPQELLDRANWEFDIFNNSRRDVPDMSYTGTIIKTPKIDGVDTMPLALGDTVRVSNTFVNIYDTLRIVKISLHPYEQSETVFTIGKPPKSIREFFRRWQQAEQVISKITDTAGKVTIPALPSNIPSGSGIEGITDVMEKTEGFQETLEDGTVISYTWTIVDGYITKLTDNNGKSINFGKLI